MMEAQLQARLNEQSATVAKMNEQARMATELKRLQDQCDAEVQRRKQTEEVAAQNKLEAVQTKLELDQMAAEKAGLVELAPDAAQWESLQVRLQAERQLVDLERAQDALDDDDENEAEQELQREGLGQGLYGGGGNNNGMNGGGNVNFDGEGRLGGMGGADYDASVRFRGEYEEYLRTKHSSDYELELPLGRGVTVEDVAAMAEERRRNFAPRAPPPAPKTTKQAPNPGERWRRLSVRGSRHNSGWS
jgi:hypothetical protein